MVSIDLDSLTILHYPDPRLKKTCEPVAEFNEDLRTFVSHMLEMMHAGKGVGLAAPQVGVNKRIFVCNLTGERKDDQVFVNPEISDMHGAKEAEEGCLSFPELFVQIRRAAKCTIRAQDDSGRPIEMHGEDLECRVWQHENDHLNGMLISDRMSPGEKIKSKKRLKEFEAAFHAAK